MAKLEMDVTYKMTVDYKDTRSIVWRNIEFNECYKIACEIVTGAKLEQSQLVADSDMTDLWIYDDDGDIQAHWYYWDDEHGWQF